MHTTFFATRGAGYNGPHVVGELFAVDGQVAILDDFSSSIVEVMDRIGSLGHGKPDLVVGDVVDAGTLDEVFPRFNMGL